MDELGREEVTEIGVAKQKTVDCGESGKSEHERIVLHRNGNIFEFSHGQQMACTIGTFRYGMVRYGMVK